jgi:hypothetical protein
MSASLPAEKTEPRSLLMLIHPRQYGTRLSNGFVIGLFLAMILLIFGVPGWFATVVVLIAIAGPLSLKWLSDQEQFGKPLMVLSMLVFAQGFHGIEHIVQWLQFHVFNLPAKQSSGLISPLNAEIVHFIWNWLVLLAVGYLVASGMRNPWAWLLLIWAAAHTFEHSYLFLHYVQSEGAQGLPGILGRGGWLNRTANSQPAVAFICNLAPAVKTATRLDVHFWWNVGETVLLMLAARSTLIRRQLHRS